MVEIRRNPNGDTRTAPKGVSFEQFQDANDSHIREVGGMMWEFSRMIEAAGERHDCTKKTHERMFYRDFVDAVENGKDFTKSEWHQIHATAERHHLLSHCPSDVNLIDVMEMIADCVCAGFARTGEVRELEIDPEILETAVENTVELAKSLVKVKG